MDRGAWQGTVHGVARSQTWLSHEHFYFQGCIDSVKPVCVCVLTCVFVTPRTVAQQAPLSVGFPRLLSLWDLLGWVAISFSRGSSWPGDWIRASYSSCIALAGRFFTTSTTWEAYIPAINNCVICKQIPLPTEMSLMKDGQYLEGYFLNKCFYFCYLNNAVLIKCSGSSQLLLCNTILPVCWEKSPCEWTCTGQTHAVHRSTVLVWEFKYEHLWCKLISPASALSYTVWNVVLSFSCRSVSSFNSSSALWIILQQGVV